MIETASKSSELHLAEISLWEVAMLESKGRLRFHLPCLEWIQQALGMPGLNLVSLSPEIAVESSRLPGEFHGDPADRMIVATARIRGLELLTQDKKIQSYGKEGYLKTSPLWL